MTPQPTIDYPTLTGLSHIEVDRGKRFAVLSCDIHGRTFVETVAAADIAHIAVAYAGRDIKGIIPF